LGTSHADATKRGNCDAFRQNRQKGLFDLPFASFYFYVVFAAAFKFPSVSIQEFFRSEIVSGIGLILCLSGLFLLILSLVSFGQSFRVGIDSDHSDELITAGVFALP
jgi:protein-S-isoprenylcysteine O-methyltransferase Ste14